MNVVVVLEVVVLVAVSVVLVIDLIGDFMITSAELVVLMLAVLVEDVLVVALVVLVVISITLWTLKKMAMRHGHAMYCQEQTCKLKESQ